ncbi:UDP-glucose 6-dehydrogenase [Candidatus Berkelbacteria bacterium RIFCSPHIGHO2_12_FULL_36_9]|uniref:UDP-glucose 6-dehydrogenase n=1 Tax=Candidatus Berkelbacteria bacterium RIFCSPHIGHO2_12_FULL_36_9 TaxID=1797469 RepID=A0A1F5EHH9_9BACT|nr:MAG: UDP-glucose 6-dehydrogenase [Candidatus Berkelbacteria bacterium RIFCSPHIGHO2_12_FULL_36_9]
MKITVIGTGYVGLVQTACLADLGNEVWGIDIDKKKIEGLKKGIIPIYEPGLEEIVKRNYQQRLFFDTNLAPAVKKTEIIFIAVGTPPKDDGQADLTYVEKAAEEIAKNMNGYKLIVNKSTVPIGTGDMVEKIIKKYYKGKFDVASNPEFLREGSAVSDFMEPDRIVVGNANWKVKDILSKLYQPLNCPILYTDIKTAEMIKYASNSMLATQISFINSLANICERVGANVDEVAKGMKLDKRIGKYAFLSAGIGYGGSCFPKDVKALIQIARRHDYHFKLLEEVENVNYSQRQYFIDKILKTLKGTKNKTVAIWGLAFKPKTDDMREAPSIDIISALLEQKIKVRAYDPVAEKEAKKIFPKLSFHKGPYETAKDADLLTVVTEWDEFKQIDLNKLKKTMKKPVIVDGRNVYDSKEMSTYGFEYVSVGR